MKKFLMACMAVLVAQFGFAQLIDAPQPSPAAKIEQKVGLTDVTVEYSRPSMKGRAIYGDLVPYGRRWRTGANKNTIVTFSDDVKVGGKDLKAGSYAIFTEPGEAVWKVYFYSDTNNWGTPRNWDPSKVGAIVNGKVETMPMDIETFTMTIDDLHNNGATLGILWEKTYVAIPFEVPTDAKTTKSIDAVMNGPSGGDYYSAASYYFESGKDLNKAKEWIAKAVEMNPDAFWVQRRQSLILAKMGDKKGAIEAAKGSLAKAKAAGNADYVKMNEDSIKEWGGM
ncbi:DUF2911 domain-containing protein [Sediminicola luteus]|uniref:Dihydrolipoamide dehydrogenase n=1 Tax=Sediminicola luteus TaxID=319238 RepID=A0A2A4G589_9FLAO|nr:DUF2911 domain-containing protein [Sediminicola luteus]PCE64129.1 dihydrolipoamide dehydrogenase [Sediminicola luteus]